MSKQTGRPYKIAVNGLLNGGQKQQFYDLIYGGSCNIDEVIDYLLNLFTSIDNQKSNKYIMRILEGINLILDEYTFNTLNDKRISVLRTFKDQYANFLKKTSMEADKGITEQLDLLESNLDTKYPVLDESMTEYNDDNDLEQLEALEKLVVEQKIKIEALTAKVDEWMESCNKAKKHNKNAQKIIAEKKATIEKLEKEISDNAKKIEKMQQTIASKDGEITTLKLEIASQEKEITELEKRKKSLNNKIQVLSSDLEAAQLLINNQTQMIRDNNEQLAILKETREKQIQAQANLEKEQEIDNYIINKLFVRGYTLDQIINELKSEQMGYKSEDVKCSLKRLQNKINIVNPLKQSLPIEYNVSSPLYITNSTFNINNNTESYDILLTADWHIDSSNIDNCLKIANDIYDYCINNNIAIILNLGDFLDAMQKPKYDCYYENMKLMDQLIEQFPSDLGIHNVILGGNHEKKLLEAGIDPLKYIANNRDDFTNLGYNHAIIDFSGSTKKQSIGIHHPNKRIVTNHNISDVISKTAEYLKTHYATVNINADDIYIDLFGHFHFPRIDVANNYAYVPSLIGNSKKHSESVWHLKVYFDQNHNIEYISINTLIHTKKFESVAEDIYQKVYK